MKKFFSLTISALSILALSGCSDKNDNQNNQSNENKKEVVTEQDMINGGTTKIKAEPFSYNKNKQMKMQPLDHWGRAVDSHIQVSKSQLPKEKRAGQLTYNPSGWHNYKVKDAEGKTYWAYNRGHLVGYQFCGLNSEPKNLITETRTLNAGAGRGTNPDNPISQLYYEQRLRKFVDSNPDKRLDLQVTPLYKGTELMPRSVRMSFVGYNHNGKQIKIKLDSNNKFVKYKGNIGQVILPNVEPTLDINYKTGMAKVLNKPLYNETTNKSSNSFIPYWLAYHIYDNMKDNIRYKRVMNEIKRSNRKYQSSTTKKVKNNNSFKNKNQLRKQRIQNQQNKIADLKKPSQKSNHSSKSYKSNLNHSPSKYSSSRSFKSSPSIHRSH